MTTSWTLCDGGIFRFSETHLSYLGTTWVGQRDRSLLSIFLQFVGVQGASRRSFVPRKALGSLRLALGLRQGSVTGWFYA